MNILLIYQDGLSLGQKEYYLDNDKATADIRNAFRQFIANMFRLYGFSDTQAAAKRDAVMRYETMLALISKSRTELRDVEANYNKMTLGEFKEKYPNIQLEQLLMPKILRASIFRRWSCVSLLSLLVLTN